MTNFVAISGRLASEPKPNPGQSGKGPTNLRISLSKRRTNQATGEVEWDNQYFTVIVWGDDRELANKLERGQTVFVTGTLQWREYQKDENSPKKEYVEINANTLASAEPVAKAETNSEEFSFN